MFQVSVMRIPNHQLLQDYDSISIKQSMPLIMIFEFLRLHITHGLFLEISEGIVVLFQSIY